MNSQRTPEEIKEQFAKALAVPPDFRSSCFGCVQLPTALNQSLV